MILIVSNDKEKSTSDVIEWLLYCGVKFEQINETTQININYSKTNNILIKISNKTINFKDIGSFWYRRGKFHSANKIYQNIDKYIVNHELEEWNRINEFLMLSLQSKRGIGSFFFNNINKNFVLHEASSIGLQTPKTLITNSKKDVITFFKNERVINKTISNVMSYKADKNFYTNKTIEINTKALPINFYPSLFQELIEKKYELRVFYLKGQFFSSAIFSQNNEKTMIDFRNYDYQKPNRTVPFQFPTSLIYVNEVMKEITGNYILNQNDLLASYKTFFYKHFDRDEHFDFIIGSCGASFLFYQLYKKTGNNVYFEFFKFCTEHLFNNSKNQGEYTFWETDKFKRLGGFSHGASSLAISMLLAYDILKEDKYLDCFNRVIKYDRSLYDSNEKAYLDIRYFPTKKISNAWAHGHGGIALSRLIIESYCQEDNKILKEIKICRNHLNKCMVNGIDNYTVNGGFAGNIEILKTLNNKLNIDNKYLDDLFNGYIGKIVSQESSLISEKNHIHLFINQGIAGLGYSILRHLFTDKVPSLLVLGVDTSFGCKYLYNEIKN